MKLFVIAFLFYSTSLCQYHDGSFEDFITKFVHSTEFTEKMKDAIFSLDRNERRLLKNAIFASKGYEFKNDTLAKFFKKYKWYQPSKVQINLSKLESKKVSFIKMIDENWEKDFQSFLKLFAKPKLPYTIKKSPSGKKIEKENYIKFLGENPNFSWGVPILYVKKSPNQYILIYSLETAAGGYNSFIQAVIFNLKGDKLVKQNLGRNSGDYGFTSSSEIKITKKLEFFCWESYEEYADYKGKRLTIVNNKSLRILNNKLEVIVESIN